jgi:type IVB pilus formation R64 PilN family outer membrane protein
MNKFKTKMMLAGLSGSILLLSGCAATVESNKDYDKYSERATKDYVTSTQKASPTALADKSAPTSNANFGKIDRNWVNPIPLPKNDVAAERANLPKFFQKNVRITMPGRVSIVEALSEIQRSNGIRVVLNQDIYDMQSGEASLVGAGKGSAAGGKDPVPLSVTDFVYHGTLESALDLLSLKANVFWKWTGSAIELYRFETKSYNITLLAGKTTAKSDVSLQTSTNNGMASTAGATGATGQSTATDTTGGMQSGTASNSSTYDVTRDIKIDSWGEIKNYLISLMSPKGTISIMESAGLVTIKDTPVAQEKVAQAIKELNALIGKQIYVDIDVYAITRTASDDYGIDWNAAWSSLGQNGSYTTQSGSAATNVFTVTRLTGPFANTANMLKALSKLGKTSVVNQFRVATLNGQQTPIGNNRKIPYISGIQIMPGVVGVGATGLPIESVTTDAIYQGISMSITPNVQTSGKVLLEYSMNLSDFEGFTQFSTGTGSNAQTLDLPTTTLKTILQRASLRSGQALVLSGFKQVMTSVNDNGVGSPSNPLLGGGTTASKQEQYLVITVTPYIAQDNE